MSFFPQYIHHINPKLKHIYLSFDDRGNLIIKSPKISQKQIEKLLLKKSSWIYKSQEKWKHKKGKSPHFTQDDTLYFLGIAYPLILTADNKKRSTLTFTGESFTLSYCTYDIQIFQKQIDTFYKAEAKKYIPILVEKWAKKMEVSPLSLSFRKTKRQWGSCSSTNKLSINTMIMKLPPDVIQYIIVHELSHITHKHHQKSFWKHVARYLPEYETQIEILKNYTT